MAKKNEVRQPHVQIAFLRTAVPFAYILPSHFCSVSWTFFDSSTADYRLWLLVKKRPGLIVSAGTKRAESFAAGVGRGLRLAANEARKTARMYGPPIYVVEHGKIVAKKP